MDEDCVVPYFMYNKDWYAEDNKTGELSLTKAGRKIKKVVESYEEWQKDEEYWKERSFDV